jgi:hypothetical protein
MPTAIEMFRQQREAAERVHQQLLEVSRLLAELQRRTAALTNDESLRTLLREEQNWLIEAQRFVAEVRYLRLAVDQRWSSKLARWTLPILFALTSALVAGVGFGAVTKRDVAEDRSLRNRAAFAETVLERLDAMTPAERRQFDRLLK